MKKVAFIGLGAMGFPMAGHLAEKGFSVCVYNRTTSVAEKWLDQYRQYKAAVANSPAKAASDADIIITCLGNDDDVNEIYTQHIFSAMPNGAILIDHTTTSATIAETLSKKANEFGAHFLDAPVSGGQVGAEQGILTIMVGGDEMVFNQSLDVLNSYAKSVNYVGDSGSGQRCKMVNQLCVAGVLQGLSEGLELAKRVGLSADAVLQSLQHGAGSSWQMVNRTKTMMDGEFDFGFAVDWMRKDLGICLDEADKYQLQLPLAKMVDESYEKLQKKGCQRSDTSVLIRQFEDE